MNENPGEVVTKFQFCALLHEAWFQSIQPETIKAGFRKAGINKYDCTSFPLFTYILIWQVGVPWVWCELSADALDTILRIFPLHVSLYLLNTF